MTYLTDREKELIKYKKQYLNLVYKITRLQLSGEDPPEELLKKVQKIERTANPDIS
jgi:7,8-dihydro-6-hydroxymethylpterin-pyrophosphokinase